VNREQWNQRYAAAEELLWSAAANRTLETEAEGLPLGRALDLACGEGRNAVWLAQQGWDVTAVDFSDVAVARGRELAGRRGVTVHWVLEDVYEFEPESGGFDLVIVLYLHVPAPARREVLRRATRGLALGGTLLVLGHDASNLADGYGGPSDPSILYSPQDLAADVPDLHIVKAEHVHREVDTDEGRSLAIDALLRATRAR